jgi:hypothetical protein
VTLARVRVHLPELGQPPTVLVDDVPVAGVRSAQVTVTADGVPQVALVLAAGQVDVELPAGVTVLSAGPSATEFAASLSPARLEAAALQRLDDSATHGEAFCAAVAAQAAVFDDRG